MSNIQNYNNLHFKWENARYTFLRRLRYKVAKTNPGTVAPKWIKIIHFILFPLHGFYAKQAQVQYDFLHDVYIIRGVKISGLFLDRLSCNAKKNTKFID